MKTSSAKAKGRRCARQTKDLLLSYAQDELEEGDILLTSSGETGPDVRLSPLAKKVYPLAIECKNTERLDIWAALRQAEGHAQEGVLEYPILFFTRNDHKLYVALEAEHFMKLIR